MKQPAISYKCIHGGITGENSKLIADIVNKNFINVVDDIEIQHDENEIKRVIESKNMYSIFAFDGKDMIGYLLGEIIESGNKTCLHIQYLYIISTHRCKGIAGTMMKLSEEDVRNKFNVKKITLTCNINHKYNYVFYEKKGFCKDNLYKSNSNYCVMSKNI